MLKSLKNYAVVPYGVAAFMFLMSVLNFSSCVSPSPLYGSWISYTEDELALNTDGTFTAKINVHGNIEELEGTWSQNGRVLQFTSDGTKFNSEWTLDAGLLQLSWPSVTNGSTIILEMYRKEAK